MNLQKQVRYCHGAKNLELYLYLHNLRLINHSLYCTQVIPYSDLNLICSSGFSHTKSPDLNPMEMFGFRDWWNLNLRFRTLNHVTPRQSLVHAGNTAFKSSHCPNASPSQFPLSSPLFMPIAAVNDKVDWSSLPGQYSLVVVRLQIPLMKPTTATTSPTYPTSGLPTFAMSQ